ncbi:MAG: hypothetical protein LQ349_007144, partial [Xanthoria aureola]
MPPPAAAVTVAVTVRVLILILHVSGFDVAITVTVSGEQAAELVIVMVVGSANPEEEEDERVVCGWERLRQRRSVQPVAADGVGVVVGTLMPLMAKVLVRKLLVLMLGLGPRLMGLRVGRLRPRLLVVVVGMMLRPLVGGRMLVLKPLVLMR